MKLTVEEINEHESWMLIFGLEAEHDIVRRVCAAARNWVELGEPELVRDEEIDLQEQLTKQVQATLDAAAEINRLKQIKEPETYAELQAAISCLQSKLADKVLEDPRKGVGATIGKDV